MPSKGLYEPERLLGGLFEIILGVFHVHSLTECNHAPQDGEEGVYSFVVTAARILGDASRKGDDRLSVFFCKSGDSHGSLSHSALTVKSAFAGDHHVCILYILLRSDGVEDQRDARLKLTAKVGEEGKADAPCRTRSRVR